MIYIVGIGPGHAEYILPKAIHVLENVDIIIGFERAIESISFIKGEKQVLSTLQKIEELLELHKGKEVGIVASGDPLFYGITNYIQNHCKEKIEVIPGISSFQYMMTKLQKPWQQSFLGSVHGREAEFLDTVKKQNLSIWLTDQKNSPAKLCSILDIEKVSCRVYIGENLSYKEERIITGTAGELKDQKFEGLAVVVVEQC